MLRATDEPLLKKLLRYVMSDEARHVAFGVLSLAEYYRQLSEAELKDRQEFLLETTLRQPGRSTTPEIWERMGTSVDAVLPVAHGGGRSKRSTTRSPSFQHALLRQARAERPQARAARRQQRVPAQALGRGRALLEFEFADDTGSRLRRLRRGGQGPPPRPAAR